MTSNTVGKADVVLPTSFWEAVKRGVLGKCPRCARGPLFRKWLKSVDACAACDQNWMHQRADDLPAYIAILVTGHVLAPILIALTLDFALSPLTIVALTIPPAVILVLAMLQPAKGAVIAVQWWHGLHGFVKERAAARVLSE